MKKLALSISLVLLLAVMTCFLIACDQDEQPPMGAVSAPSWVSTEAQTRLQRWFRIDERNALYTTLGDLTDAGGLWSLTGNTGTTAGTHYLGTTDAQNVVFKRSGTTVGTFTASGFDMLNSLIFENDESISNENDGELALNTSNIWVGADHTFETGSASSGFLSGDTNTIGAKWSAIGGGTGNTITGTAIADDARYSFMGGGQNNEIDITGDYGTMVGGVSNAITGTGSYDFMGAGYSNRIADADSAVISGGAENDVSGSHSAVPGGYDNVITSTYSLAFGRDTDVTGDYCVALGRRAKCSHDGSFVFADSTDSDYTSANEKTFNVRAAGGMIVDGDVVPQAGFQIYPEHATNTSARFDCSAVVSYTSETTQTVCVLPANVNVVDVFFIVETVFNDSGTDVIDCGFDGADPDEFVDNMDVSSAGVNRMGDGADMPYADFGDIGSSNLTVVCKYDGQNDNASAGSGTLVVSYVVD
jgi:hypothetical protein